MGGYGHTAGITGHCTVSLVSGAHRLLPRHSVPDLAAAPHSGHDTSRPDPISCFCFGFNSGHPTAPAKVNPHHFILFSLTSLVCCTTQHCTAQHIAIQSSPIPSSAVPSGAAQSYPLPSPSPLLLHSLSPACALLAPDFLKSPSRQDCHYRIRPEPETSPPEKPNSNPSYLQCVCNWPDRISSSCPHFSLTLCVCRRASPFRQCTCPILQFRLLNQPTEQMKKSLYRTPVDS